LLPVIRRVWGRRGVRVHAPYATRYQWGYLHEAIELVPGSWTGRIVKPNSAERSPCRRNVVSIVPI
jgi:hypothetical protein